MRRARLLCVALLFWSGCASYSGPNNVPISSSPKVETPTPKSASTIAETTSTPTVDVPSQEIPDAFKNVDFKNFSYPTSWRKRPVRLQYGTYRKERPEGGGGDTFEFRSVHFADVTGDGKRDAVVQLTQVSCGGSCDGGSHLFYFYRAVNKKLALFWRIETGSLAYECGLKSFVLEKRVLSLELFRSCRHHGGRFLLGPAGGDDDIEAKFVAKYVTKSEFQFGKGRVALKKKQVVPYPQEDVKGYQATISIKD